MDSTLVGLVEPRVVDRVADAAPEVFEGHHSRIPLVKLAVLALRYYLESPG